MKDKKQKKSKQKRAKIILPTPTNLAKALFMNALPQILDVWERETSKAVPFDEWLIQVYNNHAEAVGAPESALDYNAEERNIE